MDKYDVRYMAQHLYMHEMNSPGKWLDKTDEEQRTLAKNCLRAAVNFYTVASEKNDVAYFTEEKP